MDTLTRFPAAPPPLADGHPPGAAQRRVLLIEDNLGDAELIIEFMARQGEPHHVVSHVGTLAQALQRLRDGVEAPPQAVLLDLHLPDASGLEAVQRLRAAASELPIVVLTGGDDEELALCCIAAGAQDYLPKHELHGISLRRAVGHAIARVQLASERRRADALQERLAAIVESSRDAIVSCSVDGCITSWNTGAEAVFGVGRDAAIGRHVHELIRAPGPAALEVERRLFQPRQAAGPTGAEEVVRLRSDGQPVTLSVVTSVLRDDSGAVTDIAAIFRDITESRRRDDELRRVLAEQAERERRMRALTARLNTLREEERTRISREVHDGLGQQLTGLKMDLRWMARRLAAGSPPAALLERLGETERLVDETVASVQRIAVELRPSALDALGLPAAVRDEVRRFETRAGVRAQLWLDRAPEVAPAVATALFRILQELLTNVARHARASTLEVSLASDGADCVLQVSDNGVGLDAGDGKAAAGAGPAVHLGLLGMTERAAAVGGSLLLARHPRGGTVATVRVPAAAQRP